MSTPGPQLARVVVVASVLITHATLTKTWDTKTFGRRPRRNTVKAPADGAYTRVRSFARATTATERWNDGMMWRGARDRSRGARLAVASSTRGATVRDWGGD